MYRCKNCNKLVSTRVGRGLCRRCWDNRGIRRWFAVVAPFGGSAACRLKGKAKGA